MRGFLNDLYLRESCYHCPARSFSSLSDITIGDFWGVHKLEMDDMNDDKGLSVVTINTQKGIDLFNDISSELTFKKLTFDQVIVSNPNLIHIAKKNVKGINKFQRNLLKMSFCEAIDKTLHMNIINKIILKFKYKFGLIK